MCKNIEITGCAPHRLLSIKGCQLEFETPLPCCSSATWSTRPGITTQLPEFISRYILLRRPAVCQWYCISSPLSDDCFAEVSDHAAHSAVKQGQSDTGSCPCLSLRLFLFLSSGLSGQGCVQPLVELSCHEQSSSSASCLRSGHSLQRPWKRMRLQS